MTCPASTHRSQYAYLRGCRHPEAVAAHRAIEGRRLAQRRTGPTRGGFRYRADVDAVAIDRALHGDPPRIMTVAERQAAVLRLTERGHSAREIGDWLGMNCRTVQRYRNGWHLTLASAA
jgi:DNA-binding NarL/FixJ family response regulator